MSRDYANRKPRKSKNTRGRAKKPANRQPMPIVPLLVVIALVVGFAYFLWSIKGSSEAPVVVEESAPVVEPKKQPTKVKKDPNELPPKPEEKWTYQQELENKQVEVDLPESEIVQVKLYQMQCGSFRQESQAEQLRATIAFQGLEAQVKRTEGSNGLWYKVVLGPFEGKRPAESTRHRLQRAGINGCKIWLWQ
ncbi:SPOR domain-containing protein [Shewanella maritima]|uniref:SPOR domain-containing protein n=1 Tax=Shewanella maritima TaxID=2520507 RepID=UPI003734DAF1